MSLWPGAFFWAIFANKIACNFLLLDALYLNNPNMGTERKSIHDSKI